MISVLQAILGLLLVFFIPGYTLIQAIFPNRGDLDAEFDQLYRVTLAIGLSIVITILIGFGLNTLGENPSTPGQGYFFGPYIALSLTVLSIIFFIVGWYRGAYPSMGKIHPKLLRIPRAQALRIGISDKEAIMELQKLAREREKIRKNIKDYEQKVRVQRGNAKKHYERKKREAQQLLKKVDERLQELEEKRARELYEG